MKSQTRLSVRSINQSNRSISVRLSFLFCLRAFISRSYENRSKTIVLSSIRQYSGSGTDQEPWNQMPLVSNPDEWQQLIENSANS